MAESIETRSLREEVETRYRTYALSVIMSRALPDVRDGLKPVQRRILYTMYHDLRLPFDGAPPSAPKIIGERDRQVPPARRRRPPTTPWCAWPQIGSCACRSVDGQGNFGSVDGDPPAAERYTEAKLAAAADGCSPSCGNAPSPMRPNFDNTGAGAGRPAGAVSQPARQRLLRASPSAWPPTSRRTTSARSSGPASSSSRTPKRRRRSCSTGSRGPTSRSAARSSPTGPRSARSTRTGTGSIKVQGEWKTRSTAARRQIVVTSIPYGVDKGKLEKRIGDIIADPQAAAARWA